VGAPASGDEADEGKPESAPTGCGFEGPEGPAPSLEGEVPAGTAALYAPYTDPRSACANDLCLSMSSSPWHEITVTTREAVSLG
jgi:hypothetical protein